MVTLNLLHTSIITPNSDGLLAFSPNVKRLGRFPRCLSASLAKAAVLCPLCSILGAQVFMGNEGLLHLARIVGCGVGKTLSSWQVPLL